MKVSLEATNNLEQYLATNESGHEVRLSGDGTAAGPMQAVLMAIAGCSTIDIVMILQKMRQDLRDIKVEVEGTRRDEIPKVFTKIHMHYKLYGEIKAEKAEQAIALSTEKYCSVSKMLEKAAEISTSYEIFS
ncbi:MAG: putative redox protein [Saprospiraceae bacterium]|jgi:putative redox protein